MPQNRIREGVKQSENGRHGSKSQCYHIGIVESAPVTKGINNKGPTKDNSIGM